MFKEQKVLLSGIQPTGIMTIGNYIGAVKNWLKLQDDYLSVYFIADLHALTVRQNPTEFKQRALSFFAQYLAFGLDPEKSILYFQSHVPEHTQLQWALNCFTYVGEAQRMTQFKDKSAKHTDNINMGLMDYPVLMAADILLFKTNCVPVGIDQRQHLEIARDIALRFNNIYGDTFVVPEARVKKFGAKIASLQNPLAKMSKSDPNPNAVIGVLDSEKDIIAKIKKAVTDSGSEIIYDPENKPGVSNLLTILSIARKQSIDELVKEFEGKMYGHLKLATADAVVEMLRPFRERFTEIRQDEGYLAKVAKDGAERASAIAEKTLKEVKEKIGFVL